MRGDWQARISAYKKLFHTCPFQSYLGQLEELRKRRNSAGHSFGRDIESMRFAEFSLVRRLPNILDVDRQKYLACIENVADLVEEHLAAYVGQYEVIKLFHRWLPGSGLSNASKKQIASAFSVYVNGLTGNAYGKAPGLELIKYYERI